MDTSLKQRLTGAIILVALAVIFLPMLIKSPAPDSEAAQVSLSVPDAPTSGYEVRQIPLNAPANSAMVSSTDSGTDPNANIPTALDGINPPVNTTNPVTTAALAPTSPDAAQLAPPKPTPTDASGPYAVRYGAYATIDDAEQVIARLGALELKAYRELININGTPAWRVFIGPYPDRAQAEVARTESTKVRAGVRAEVVSLNRNENRQLANKPTPQAIPEKTVAQQAPVNRPVKVVQVPAIEKPTKAEREAQRAAQKAAAEQAATERVLAQKLAEPLPEPKQVVAIATPARGSNLGFAVQIGAFAQESEAATLRSRAEGAGFTAFVERVNTSRGVMSRVRIGPVMGRAEADKLKAQAAAKLGANGIVVPHPN